MPEPEQAKASEPPGEPANEKKPAPQPAGMFSDLTPMQKTLMAPELPPPRWFRRWLSPQKETASKPPVRVLRRILRYIGYFCTGFGAFSIAVLILARYAIDGIPGARPHSISLLYRWWASSAQAVGSNPLGFALLVVEPLATLVVAGFVLAAFRGWEEMKQELGKSILITFVVTLAVQVVLFGPVFIWHGVETVYRDHQSLVDENSRLRNAPPKIQTVTVTPEQPKESANSLRLRTMRLVDELSVFWSHRPAPLQPVQNPSTDEERKRNALSDQYWRDAETAYLNANYRERLLGIVREYKNKGIATGYMEQGFDQPNRLVGAAPFGGSQLEDCFRFMNELCQLRELAYHVDAQDQPIFLTSKPRQ